MVIDLRNHFPHFDENDLVTEARKGSLRPYSIVPLPEGAIFRVMSFSWPPFIMDNPLSQASLECTHEIEGFSDDVKGITLIAVPYSALIKYDGGIIITPIVPPPIYPYI